MGQNAKYSERADVFRFTPDTRHCVMQSALRICARCGLNAQREASYSIRGVPHAVAPMLSGMNSCHSADHLPCLLADLAADDIAEQFPTLALEFPELKLLDRSEVNCAGVDRDTGQEPFQL